MTRILALFALVFCAQISSAQVDRENSRDFSSMLKDAIGEVDSTKYPVLKLYPVTVTDRTWYDNSRRGVSIIGERSPVKKGWFTYDPLDTLNNSFAIKVDADLIAKGLFDAGYEIEGVSKRLSLHYYNAGDSCWVLADTTGIQFATSSGIGYLQVPEGVTLLSMNLFGSLDDLDPSGRYSIIVTNSNVNYNTGAGDMRAPDFQIINATSFVAGGPSAALPFVYDEGNAPQRQIIGVNNGEITLRAINLDAFSFWIIKLHF